MNRWVKVHGRQGRDEYSHWGSMCQGGCGGDVAGFSGGVGGGAEFSRETAPGKKLFLNLLVRERLGWELYLVMLRALRRHLLCWTASMVGSEECCLHFYSFQMQILFSIKIKTN